MKRMMQSIWQVLPHVSIVLAGLLLVLFGVDYFNGSMGFLDSDVAKMVLVLVCVTSIVNAFALITQNSAAER